MLSSILDHGQQTCSKRFLNLALTSLAVGLEPLEGDAEVFLLLWADGRICRKSQTECCCSASALNLSILSLAPLWDEPSEKELGKC